MFSRVAFASTAEALLINLGLDLLGGIAQEDSRAVVTGRHLGAGTLQGVEETHVDEGGLGVLETSRTVSCQTEVGVLVNGAGNKAGNLGCALLVVAKDVRERRGKGGGALNTGKVNFANV